MSGARRLEGVLRPTFAEPVTALSFRLRIPDCRIPDQFRLSRLLGGLEAKLGLFGFLEHALVNPDLDAQHAISRERLRKTPVDVRIQGVERHASPHLLFLARK